MSTKEQIKKIAANSNTGKLLSAQMILANKRGSDAVIRVGNKKIKLVRTTEMSVRPK